MDFKVILTPQAQDDLREIVSFIARNNSSRARTFGNELIDKALSLVSLPERGRVVPEIAESSVREMVHGSYIESSTKYFANRRRCTCFVSGTRPEESRKSKNKPYVRHAPRQPAFAWLPTLDFSLCFASAWA